MPTLALPPNVPLGAWWYALWISVNGILIYIMCLMRAPDSRFARDSEESAEENLPSLNEYLWRLLLGNEGDSYAGPLNSIKDLKALIKKARAANKPLAKFAHLIHHLNRGILYSIISIVLALICLALYLSKTPSLETASQISWICLILPAIFITWHISRSIWYYYSLSKMTREED